LQWPEQKLGNEGLFEVKTDSKLQSTVNENGVNLCGIETKYQNIA
jgi:hypothetical protein